VTSAAQQPGCQRQQPGCKRPRIGMRFVAPFAQPCAHRAPLRQGRTTMPSPSRLRPHSLHLLEAFVLIVVILVFGKYVLVPLALAVMLTFILHPIVAGAQRAGLPRIVAVLVVATLAFGLLATIGWGVGSQVRRLAED